jgi:hypothetical protein
MKLAVLPRMVPAATMNQPFMPNTKPAIVTQVEYPIKGGKDTKKVMKNNISHPTGRSLHFCAAGARAWKMRSENMRARMERMKAITAKAERPSCWRGVSCDQARTARVWSLSAKESQVGCEVLLPPLCRVVELERLRLLE